MDACIVFDRVDVAMCDSVSVVVTLGDTMDSIMFTICISFRCSAIGDSGYDGVLHGRGTRMSAKPY